MRLLLIHSDHIDYEAKKPTSMAEQAENLRDSMDEALVAFCAVEAADEDDMGDVVEQAVADIAKTASQLDVARVMVYPYAHLASDLATAGAAIEALDAVSEGLRGLGFEVKRAPFGWYKAFTSAARATPSRSSRGPSRPAARGRRRWQGRRSSTSGSSSPPTGSVRTWRSTWTSPPSAAW